MTMFTWKRFLLMVALTAGCGNTDTNTSGNDMSMADSSVATGPNCTDYCNTIMANCNNVGTDAGVGGTQQYSDIHTCMGSCTTFPVGTSADTMGNTLGCRIYHAKAAK